MARIVIATWDGGGNVPPALAIGRELSRRGHDLLIIGHDGNRAAAQRDGFPFASYTTARDFVGADRNSPLGLLNTLCERAMGDDVAEVVRSFRADLVVVDCLLPAVLERMVSDGIRFVVLEHLFDAFLRNVLMRGPYGIGLRIKGFRYGQLTSHAQRCIVTTLPTLDPNAARTAANVEFTGPTCTGVPSIRQSVPRLVVSLSTFGYAGLPATYRRIIGAVAQLPVQVTVTTGGLVDPASLPAPENVELRSFVPHAELFPEVSLVVTHGGHSTTMAALAHDIPLLILPMQSTTDQPMVGAAVQRAGAGRKLKRRSRPATIRDAIDQLLADPGARTGAARLGREIRSTDGASAAGTVIEKAL